MDSNAKSIISRICLIAIYILLGIVGVYYAVGLALFPIIAVPLIVYFIKNKLSKEQHIVFQFVIVLGIYLTTSNLICILVYLISACIPTYVVLYFYKEEFPLPNIIMYATLSLSVVVLGFFVLMKYLGIDFQAQYASILDSIKGVSLDTIQEWLIMQNPSFTTSNIAELGLEMKQLINSIVDAMQSVYSALIILQLLISTGFLVIIVNTILRRKNKSFPSLKELLSFRLSKMAVLILFISMIAIASNGNEGARWSILGLNVAFFLMTLFQITGALALVGILSRAKINKGIKIIGCVTIFLLLSISPYLVMFFGCLDTIFNYRKVKIVV